MVSRGRILFVDNNPSFLKNRAEFLENNGFHVLKAHSLEEARKILANDLVHLAILDIRTVDDDDESDISGLIFARNEAYRSIPKIILTGFPSYEYVREVLGPALEGLPPAVDFLAKQEGLEAMLQAVERAFTRHVSINWDIAIQPDERNLVTFLHLVTFIEGDLEGERLLIRSKEMEDLFRRLFYEEYQIRIERLLWQRDKRIAVTVFAFAKGKPPESFIVVCGNNKRVIEESRRYKDYSPKASGPTSTVLNRASETLRFAANVYTLPSSHIENVRSLIDLYHAGSEKSFNNSLKTLYEETLADWNRGERILEESKSLDELYRARLGLTPENISQAAFEERVRSLVHQIPTLGPIAECVSNKLRLKFYSQSFEYPDPASFLYKKFNIGQPVLLMNAPGMLSGDSILTDTSERVWVTDFADAGLVPLLWNFVTLEAAIRFDWVEPTNLEWLHEMERYLADGDYNNFYVSDVEAPLRKSMKVIQTIRRLASRMAGKDLLPYHLGILFHAASRIAKFDPEVQITPNELARLAHILLAAAIICDRIRRSDEGLITHTQSEDTGIRIDKANRAVWVDGKRVPLRGQSYELLLCLYEHPNQLQTRREIVERILEQKYDDTDNSQMSRLNTAIHRLREKIGDDPDDPRFLFTEPGGGYRLVPNP